jgi:hypothetical protein
VDNTWGEVKGKVSRGFFFLGGGGHSGMYWHGKQLLMYKVESSAILLIYW